MRKKLEELERIISVYTDNKHDLLVEVFEWHKKHSQEKVEELRAIEESCTDDKFGTIDTDLFAGKVLDWMARKEK